MNEILTILVCLGLGLLLRRLRIFPDGAAVALNRFVIFISLPALVLLLIPKLELSGRALVPASMAWLVFAGAAAVVSAVGRWRKWPAATTGALILTAGLGNTSFLGFPLIEAFFGREALAIGLLTDQLGSFLVLSSLGVLTASAYSGKSRSAREIVLRVLKFPPFQALLVGLALRPFGTYPDPAIALLERLGGTLLPLCLVSVGMQLRFHPRDLRAELAPLGLGLAYKLALAPGLFALVVAGGFGARGLDVQVSVFQAAMAPMITAAILAADEGLNSRLANLMLGVGIPLSLITVALWWRISIAYL